MSEAKRAKPSTRALLTGTARPVANSVERAREYFQGHPETTAPAAKERKNLRGKRPEIDAEEPPTEPETDGPEREGKEEGEDQED